MDCSKFTLSADVHRGPARVEAGGDFGKWISETVGNPE